MILIYPALVSESIPQDMMPAVTKLLERYLIVYHWDSQIERARRMSVREFNSSYKALFEDKDVVEMFGSNYLTLSESAFNKKYDKIMLDEAKPVDIYKNLPKVPEPWITSVGGVGPTSPITKVPSGALPIPIATPDPYPEYTGLKYEDELRNLVSQREQILHSRSKNKNEQLASIMKRIEFLKNLRKNTATVDVSTVNLSVDMVLEPTNIKLDLEDGTLLLGVKVIPFYINSNITLPELLLADRKLIGMKAKITRMTRMLHKKILRLYYRTLGRLPLMPGRPSTITGDPYKDIILAQTDFDRRVFAVLDKNDVANEFFQSAGGVKKLFGLGWNNLVFIDDINKRGIFCMKKFNGLCSTIPFPTMFSSLGGRENLYNSLEQARTSTSPFFRARKQPSGLFSESQELVDNKLMEFRKLSPDQVLIQEDISSFISSVKNVKEKFFSSQVESIKKSGNIKDLQKFVERNKLFTSNPDTLYKIGSKYSKDFSKSYAYAYKVVDNTFDNVSDTGKKALTTYIAGVAMLRSLGGQKNIIGETKAVIHEVVSKLLDMTHTLVTGVVEPENVKSITKVLLAGVVIFGVWNFQTLIATAIICSSIVLFVMSWFGAFKERESI